MCVCCVRACLCGCVCNVGVCVCVSKCDDSIFVLFTRVHVYVYISMVDSDFSFYPSAFDAVLVRERERELIA